MSVFEQPKLQKLDKQPLWIKTSEVVEYMYGKIDELPDYEKWTTAIKIRNASSDLLFAIAQALGDSSPAATEFGWSQARKHATSLKAIYRFACRQKFLEIEPGIMVKLDEILDLIDTEVKDAFSRTKKANLEEIESWQKKYKMWEEMHE